MHSGCRFVPIRDNREKNTYDRDILWQFKNELNSFLGQEDPLEKGMATHSCLGNPVEEPGGLHSSQGQKESDTTEATKAFTFSRHFMVIN